MLGIAVANAQTAHDALPAAGVAISRKLKDNSWGDRSFAVRDPDGICVWVYQITDARLAHDLGLIVGSGRGANGAACLPVLK